MITIAVPLTVLALLLVLSLLLRPRRHASGIVRHGALWRSWSHWRARRQARIDAKLGHCLPEPVVEHRLGAEPVFDEINCLEHQDIQVDLISTDVDAWKRERDVTERALTFHSNAYSWRLLALGLGAGEWEASELFFRDLGAIGIQKHALSAMLTVGLFLLPIVASHTARSKDAKGRPRPSPWFPWVIGAFGLVALALGAYRVSSIPSDQGSSRTTEVAVAVIMVLASVGPALASDWVFRKLAPVAQLTKLRRQLRRKIRDGVRKIERARARRRNFDRDLREYRHEAKRLAAAYELENRRWRVHTMPANDPPDLRLVGKEQS